MGIMSRRRKAQELKKKKENSAEKVEVTPALNEEKKQNKEVKDGPHRNRKS